MFISKLKLIQLAKVCCRQKSSAIVSSQITFNKCGNPVDVLELVESKLSAELNNNEVLLKMLLAPIHPADINTIQGVYGIKPALPAVPGLEGVAEVVQVGSGVKTLKLGDKVIPVKRTFGTWRTHQVCSEEILDKVPNEVPILHAANIMLNPGTAYHMLMDYVSLKPGDTVIQNLANSMVGLAAIQISHHLGFKTVNIIRDRPNIDEIKEYMSSMGANYVITEGDLRTKTTSIFKEVPRPRLALNGTGGSCATEMQRWMAEGGTMVTYGGMSRQPLTVPTSVIIFKDIAYRGFWFHRWLQSQENSLATRTMLKTLYHLAQSGKLKPPPCTVIPFSKYKEAMTTAMEQFVGKKQVLDFSNA